MKNEWIIIAVILFCVFALVFYLIKRNQKDKEEYARFLNETEIKHKPRPEED
jgi:preprotein translocase subunit YajC